MAVEILMPELGESVHEGTVSRWLKKEGDFVKEDEPVVEIMTDKVNTELPAPVSGILTKILIQEGDAVEVFHAMGIIEEQTGAAKSAAPTEPAAAPAAEVITPLATPVEATVEEVPVAESGDKRWFTPVVKAIAKEQGLTDAQLASIAGTGEGGRVTKKDVEAYLAGSVAKEAQKPVAVKPAAPAPTPQPKPAAPTVAGPEQSLTPLVGMRKMIADHMVRSSQVPTVTTVTQVDVTNMVKFRERNKDTFQETYGVKLTYTPFFIKALAETLLEFPLANSSLTPDNQILTTKGVHIGVAVALGAKGDEGLIVPVIRDCHTKTLIQIAKDLESIAKAARSNSLKPTDVQGGTFTLTNPGTYGALFGTPMINAPQAGILGTYSIQKTPVIIDDMIAIRSIMHLVLTYDHRIIDGLVAGKFLAAIRDRLQSFDFFK
jgi:pyruvate/2-oxoglutarate dehydrogenase complex dihydrolipoamide acyltransferase (E2) component